MNKEKPVVVLGATNDKNRYSNMALNKLIENNYKVIPVHPILKTIDGINVVNKLNEINEEIDTITIYISPHHLKKIIDDIIILNPRRVIFNPGTESEELKNKLQQENIETVEACTLVLLQTNQF